LTTRVKRRAYYTQFRYTGLSTNSKLIYFRIDLSILICSITNHTAQQREKNSGTGRTRLTALTAALGNGKIKTKVVTTSTNTIMEFNVSKCKAMHYCKGYKQRIWLWRWQPFYGWSGNLMK